MSRVLALLTVVVLALVAVWFGLQGTAEERPERDEVVASETYIHDDDAVVPSVERTERRNRHAEAPVGAEDVADAKPPPPVREIRNIRFVTESGTPIPLLGVSWGGSDIVRDDVVTDAAGRAELFTLSVLQSAFESGDFVAELEIGRRKHKLAPGSSEMVLPDAQPLELVVVHARTDLPLGRPTVVADGVEHATRGLLLVEGITGKLRLPTTTGLVRGPLADRQLDGLVPTCRVAKGYRLVVPMRPVVEVPVRWLSEEDPGPLKAHVRYSAARVGSSLEFDADGIAMTRGFPFFRGERLTATVSSDTHEGSATATVLQPGRQSELVVALSPRIEGEIGVGGGGSGSFSSRSGTRRTRKPHGGLVIQAFRRDGTPAAGINVRPGGTTDELGIVRISGLWPGRRHVRFDEPGVVPSWTEVEVESGIHTHVVLREREGRTVTLTSRDDEGVPLRYARVEVHQPSGVNYVSIDERGIADLALWTDSQGRLTLPRLEERGIALTVRYGSRTVRVEAEPDQPDVEAVFKPVR